jgi:endonuclease YncB( thermonuclease family)
MRAFLVAGIIALLPVATLAGETIPGPVTGAVISVYDGDTLTVDASPWPGLTVRTSVRIDGIDTPEIRGKCDREKALAVQARDRLRALAGATVQLTDIRLGKYAGRVVADVWSGGKLIADVLISEGLGRVYDGGKREGWCE